MPETNFFWDPLTDNILQERDEAGTVTAEYTTEPGLYGNLIGQNRSSVESQYHFDATGSTLALTDDNQQVTDTYAYTAFGEVSKLTGSTVNPLQFVGEKDYYHDEPTNDYLVRRRSLSSADGRWLSVDPVANQRDSHYCYVANNPAVLIDPTGLQYIYPGPFEPDPGSLPTREDDPLAWERLQDLRCCLEWALRQKGLGWIVGLPNCPCYLVVKNGTPVNPNPKIWHDPTEYLWGYHPGAKWCMRSFKIANKAGQQCCFDHNGNIIMQGEGAGTPDRVSPDYYGFDTSHSYEDVIPFDKCKRVGMLRIYFEHRPPNKCKPKPQPVPRYGPIPQY